MGIWSQHPGRRCPLDSLAKPQLTPVICAESNRHLFAFDPIRHPANHSIEYLMRKSTDSSIAVLVGITRTLMCFSLARTQSLDRAFYEINGRALVTFFR